MVAKSGRPCLTIDHLVQCMWGDEEGRLMLLVFGRLFELQTDEAWIGDDGTPGLANGLELRENFYRQPDKNLKDDDLIGYHREPPPQSPRVYLQYF